MDIQISQQPAQQVAFVFNNVENYAELVAAFHAGVEVHVLDAARDGLAQMAAVLAGRSGIEALHVIGHGARGALDMGSVTLGNGNIAAYSDVLERIGSALAADGDILLYGCDVGADAQGAQFVGQLARATGADVAASTGPSGGWQRGGDWTLEYHAGDVTAGGTFDAAATRSLDTLLALAVKDVTDTSQRSPGLFVPGFTLTSSVAVVGDPDPLADGIYIDSSARSASFTISADGSSVGSFDLRGMTFLKLLDNFPHFQIAITGYKAAGGTATAVIDFATNSSTATVPDDFSDMTGLIRFDVTINVLSTEAGGAWDLTLDAFTVDNVAAPPPSAADLKATSDAGTSSTDNITSANAIDFTGTGTTGATVAVFIDVNGNGAYDAGTDVRGTATVVGGSWTVTGLSTLGLNGSYQVYAQQTASGATSPLSTALTVTFDHTAPTLAITSNKSALKTGETATITFTFSEDPGATFDASDIVVSGGTLSALTTTGAVRTAIFTPTGDTNGGTASITVAAGRFTDVAGNNGGAGTTPSLVFDTRAPTVSVSSSSTALFVGQTATITFTFSEDPGASFSWDGSNGDLVVAGGTLGAITGTGTTRTATFTADGSTTTASVQVKASSYTDAAGNAGGAANSPAITVTLDSTPPAAPSMPDLSSASDSGSSTTDNVTVDSTPSFTGTAEAGATVKLYEGATQIGSGTADSGGNWTITAGTLAEGTHSITAVATDASGNTGAASAALSVTIDSTAPTIAITSNKPALKAGESAIVTFTFSEDPGASFTWDGSAGDVVVSGGTLSAISGTGTVRTATFTPAANANGTASITVAAGAYADAAGNNGGAGATPSLVFDTLPPTLTITSNMSALKAGETALITFTFSEDPGATFYWDGSSGDLSVSGGSLSALSGTGTVRTAVFTPEADTNVGTASISADAGAFTDAAGNAGGAGASPSLTFDTLTPAASSTPDLASASDSGASDSDNLTAGTTHDFTGTAESGALVRLYDGASEIGSAVAIDGTWSITAGSLTAGMHSITAVVTDAAGNVSAPSGALEVMVDRSAPVLAITSSASALKAGETAVITFTFSEDPGDSFAAGDIVVSGGTLGELSGTGATRTAVFTPAAASQGSASIAVAAGAYVDAAGNAGGSGALALQIDTLAPTLAISSDTAALRAGQTATIVFTFSEDPGATFTLDDITVSGGTLGALAGSGNTRSAVFTPAPGVNGGTASITVASGRYTDAAGNGGEAGATPALAFDTLAPDAPGVPDLLAVHDTGDSASDNVTNATTPVFSGTAEAGAIVTLYDGATVIGTGVASAGGEWEITASALAHGTHSVSATATDAAGNVSAAGPVQAITVDTSAPTLAITSNRGALKAGETAVITFTFSEDPGASFHWDGASGDITVSGGTLSALSGTGMVRTATFTPAADSNGGTASISVADGAYTDAAGNAGGAGATPSITFDTRAPSLAITADRSALKIGDTAVITFTFSEDPGASFDTSDIVVAGGTLGALSGTGNIRTATFTPAEGATGTASISVAVGAYTDAAGNAGGSGAAPALVFDTLAPSAPVLALASSSDTGASGSDQVTSDTTPTFTGTAEEGTTVTLYGSDGVTVIGTGVANGGTWSITASELAAGSHMVSARATDAAGNQGVASAPLAITIDNAAPSLSITSSAPALKAGETATITFTFSEDPGATFAWEDIVVSGGTLGALAGTGAVRTATFTPAAGTNSGAAGITVAQGAYQDLAGNAGGAGAAPSLVFDTLAPTLAISSDVAALKAGETATITFTFSEDPGATFTGGDVVVTGGTLGPLAGTGNVRTATFTP
ncbi:Ig-like domain-containing protein [Pseudoduganella sp. GCM10020061]|uniref:Ig-like domain-containing protein n=1 Tax=Pseudoduganella sp. GCM10020061 TaxID=3317345 RepID=UPI0036293040